MKKKIILVFLFCLLWSNINTMEKPFHHLPDGSFRNPEGSPERDPNIKWSYKIFNEERKKIKIDFPKDHVVPRTEVLQNLEKFNNTVVRPSFKYPEFTGFSNMTSMNNIKSYVDENIGIMNSKTIQGSRYNTMNTDNGYHDRTKKSFVFRSDAGKEIGNENIYVDYFNDYVLTMQKDNIKNGEGANGATPDMVDLLTGVYTIVRKNGK